MLPPEVNPLVTQHLSDSATRAERVTESRVLG